MRRRGEEGFTSVELAMIMPVVVLVLGMAVTAMVLVVDLLQVTDAARVGARAASRGESGIEVRRQAHVLAPDGADVDVRRRGRSVTVTVSSRARGPAAWFPGLHPDATATARLEPGVR
ncbi:TadE family type IV pilus minor pilin [Kytococcus sedentarius]|uniref:TadE family type IV pilus minor pilin n=1 Tax=Kytococcus sedentarius TaxID=1276 RepID=UPI0035BBA5EA